MKQLIEYIACSLVDKPGEVRVTQVESADATTIELRVANDDLGKIIGKRGRTARAMRILLGGASIRANRRLLLDIVE